MGRGASFPKLLIMGQIGTSKPGSKLRQEKNTTRTSVRGKISSTPSPFNIFSLLFQYKFLKSKNEPHVKIEGKDTDDWLCVDFGKLS